MSVRRKKRIKLSAPEYPMEIGRKEFTDSSALRAVLSITLVSLREILNPGTHVQVDICKTSHSVNTLMWRTVPTPPDNPFVAHKVSDLRPTPYDSVYRAIDTTI